MLTVQLRDYYRLYGEDAVQAELARLAERDAVLESDMAGTVVVLIDAGSVQHAQALMRRWCRRTMINYGGKSGFIRGSRARNATFLSNAVYDAPAPDDGLALLEETLALEAVLKSLDDLVGSHFRRVVAGDEEEDDRTGPLSAAERMRRMRLRQRASAVLRAADHHPIAIEARRLSSDAPAP